jgi:16S rRNA (guanine(966)-N(2))-methyltransferase RsmD
MRDNMAKRELTTRIIAGKYKGKTIDLPALDVTRSSKAILKESFFNVLQFDIMDCIFIEGFGGSGSIGLEALSRGASSSYFVEINKGSFKTLRKNCDFLDASNTTTLLGDTFEILPKLINSSIKHTDKRVVLYLDPPFDFRDGMSDIYEKTYELVNSIDNNNVFLIAFEHKAELELPETIGNYSKFKIKKFGNSTLSYYN